jgi:hypothetical protein
MTTNIQLNDNSRPAIAGIRDKASTISIVSQKLRGFLSQTFDKHADNLTRFRHVGRRAYLPDDCEIFHTSDERWHIHGDESLPAELSGQTIAADAPMRVVQTKPIAQP